MTEHARLVLDDCRQALLEIYDGVTGRQWRIRWVAAVTLLRTVGYVLKKVDGDSDTLMNQLINKEWGSLNKTKPYPAIFWEFIEKERNSVLHEYKIVAGQGVTARPGSLSINLRTGQQSSGPSGPTTYSYKINEGYYKGYDQRDLIQEAIGWWDEYLGRIEKDYQTQKTSVLNL